VTWTPLRRLPLPSHLLYGWSDRLAGEPPSSDRAPRVLTAPPHHHDPLQLSIDHRSYCHAIGHVFTAPGFFLTSGRQLAVGKLIATAPGVYKLSLPSASPCIPAATAPTYIPNPPLASANFGFPPSSLKNTVTAASLWPALPRLEHTQSLSVLASVKSLIARESVQLC
jgi:hypothetical protein